MGFYEKWEVADMLAMNLLVFRGSPNKNNGVYVHLINELDGGAKMAQNHSESLWSTPPVTVTHIQTILVCISFHVMFNNASTLNKSVYLITSYL